jgi:hypothetical protein
MANIDLQYDADGDILFDEVEQDLAIGTADEDNISDLMAIIPGQLRYAPTVGWAIVTKLNGTITQEDIADLKQQLANDGYTNVTITFENGQLTVSNNQ